MTHEVGLYFSFLNMSFACELKDNWFYLLTTPMSHPQVKGRDVSEPGAWLVPAAPAGSPACQYYCTGIEAAAALFVKPLPPWAIQRWPACRILGGTKLRGHGHCDGWAYGCLQQQEGHLILECEWGPSQPLSSWDLCSSMHSHQPWPSCFFL